jgi:hypothetical protein
MTGPQSEALTINLSKFTNNNCGKKYQEEAAQSKQSPNRGKFTKSGHPASQREPFFTRSVVS